MEKQKLNDWSILMFFVYDVYGATKKFKIGEPALLAGKIRKTAVSVPILILF